MSKTVVVNGRAIRLYSDDGRTWVSRKGDLKFYRRKLAKMVKITRFAFKGKELLWA